MPHSPDLDRLAATVLQPGFAGTSAPGWLLRRLAGGLGGVVLFARNISEDTAGLVRRLREENPEVIVAVDEEGGTVTRLEAATGSSWPGNAALGVVDDTGVTERTGEEIGLLLGAAGITMDYAPDVDVNADPRNPVIGVRSFGADAALVARHAAAWITGLQGTGVAACAKHFPGHGDTVTDSHLALPAVHASRELLDRRDLPPFRAAIAAGVRAIMCGHLMVPALDPVLPATLSRRVLTGLLREELGFQGLVVTDAIDMKAVSARLPQPEIAVRALAAGADALCLGASDPEGDTLAALREAIVRAVHDGTLEETRLAEAASRVRALGAHGTPPAPEDRTGPGPAPLTAGPARESLAAGPARESLSAGPGREPPMVDRAGVVLDPGHRVSLLGLETARRALRVTGRTARPVLTGPPVVVEMTARPHQAAAAARYGPGDALAARLPGTVLTTLTPSHHDLPALGDPAPSHDLPASRGPAGRRGPAGAPLVVVTHDAHRHAWMRRVLAEILLRRPDAIVVEMGLPGPPAGALHLTTHGESRASSLAVAEWLTRP
ncbi:glycoside hydrolase family 3 protein [Sphaerisporangium corydalis]|uniref:Glycoside hydrolase family 3 protein n=1 Tax=Sphaerisporangium corydalis TaxID=1441875 RepID=A0ABV9E741_9ACTN|nr:glycoside hydrolase family 3 N-terminal domain-containing protein [Sphaerisporangium corydalis]